MNNNNNDSTVGILPNLNHNTLAIGQHNTGFESVARRIDVAYNGDDYKKIMEKAMRTVTLDDVVLDPSFDVPSVLTVGGYFLKEITQDTVQQHPV